MPLLGNAERQAFLSDGQEKARQRRIKHTQKPGRPIKVSGIYYTEHVLLDPETFVYVKRQKMSSDEPIGSVIHRLIMQKKVEAHEVEIVEDSPEAWDNVWKATVADKGIPVYRQSTIH